MPTRPLTEEPVVPELEAIAVAAAEELCRLMDGDYEGEQGPCSSLCRPASAAIAASMPLAAIAHAERVGQTRARHELGDGELPIVGKDVDELLISVEQRSRQGAK